jgi:hypothetical protein
VRLDDLFDIAHSVLLKKAAHRQAMRAGLMSIVDAIHVDEPGPQRLVRPWRF